MTKTSLNQNAKYTQELMDEIEPDFIFSNEPINRFNAMKIDENESSSNKIELLKNLKRKIDSIENCNLKNNSKMLVMGDGECK